MQRREWPTLAAWFDESQGDEGDLWHRTLIYPGILKVIGKLPDAKSSMWDAAMAASCGSSRGWKIA